jgi:cbb3-type cytochrome oxidase maturation protein
MTALAWLLPIALLLGALGLATFMWALRSGQFEDLEGAAYRALEDEPLEDNEAVRARFDGREAGLAVERRTLRTCRRQQARET